MRTSVVIAGLVAASALVAVVIYKNIASSRSADSQLPPGWKAVTITTQDGQAQVAPLNGAAQGPLKEPARSEEQLIEKLEARGFTPAAARAVASEIRKQNANASASAPK